MIIIVIIIIGAIINIIFTITGYDAHFLLSNSLKRHGLIQIISATTEKMISIQIGPLLFKGSYQMISKGLDSLAQSLPNDRFYELRAFLSNRINNLPGPLEYIDCSYSENSHGRELDPSHPNDIVESNTVSMRGIHEVDESSDDEVDGVEIGIEQSDEEEEWDAAERVTSDFEELHLPTPPIINTIDESHGVSSHVTHYK